MIGVDETPESLVGAAQAEALRADDAQVVVVAAEEPYLATHAGLSATHAEESPATRSTRSTAPAARC